MSVVQNVGRLAQAHDTPIDIVLHIYWSMSQRVRVAQYPMTIACT